MALLVQKFGGTSLATIQHINHVANLIRKNKNLGHDIVVIVSAMYKETEKLIKLSHHYVNKNSNSREYAVLVSSGEQISMALVTMALINLGIYAKSYTGMQIGIRTSNEFNQAKIQEINTEIISNNINKGIVVVISGFQGVDYNGNITLLDRGGSDITAVAIAAALNADECQIYTDIDGIYTADPKIVYNAKHLKEISFDTMLEYSSSGAKVLQTYAAEIAYKYSVPVQVLSIQNKDKKTLICKKKFSINNGPIFTGITFSCDIVKITIYNIPNNPNIIHYIIDILDKNICIDTINQCIVQQNKINLIFSTNYSKYITVHKYLKNKIKSIGINSIIEQYELVRLSIIGIALQNNTYIISTIFKALSKKNISIQLITTTETKISILIDKLYLCTGIKILHNIFDFGIEY